MQRKSKQQMRGDANRGNEGNEHLALVPDASSKARRWRRRLTWNRAQVGRANARVVRAVWSLSVAWRKLGSHHLRVFVHSRLVAIGGRQEFGINGPPRGLGLSPRTALAGSRNGSGSGRLCADGNAKRARHD